MSLILKALKKSEQERQMGRVPGLDSQPMHMPREPQSDQKRWSWLLLVTAVLVAGAWWLGQESVREEALSPPVLPEPSSTVSSSVSQSVAVEVSPTSAPVGEPAVQRKPTAVVDNANGGRTKVSTTTQSSEPVPTGSTDPKPVSTVVSQPASPKRAASLMPASKPIEPVAKSPQANSLKVNEASAAVEQAKERSANEPRLPLVAELPVAERQSLPTLKQSLHIYSAEPVRRAIIIDGKRYAEGDVMQPGLTVEHIRRDGTVLRWEGRQLLLTRP